MYVAVGVGLMVGTVEDKVVPKKSGGEGTAYIERVVAAVGETYLTAGGCGGCLRRERNGAAEGTVSVGRCSHTALYLRIAQK